MSSVNGANPAASRPTKKAKKRGVVHIIRERCKGCGVCITFCPNHVLEFNDDYNAKGYHTPTPVAPEKCVGCEVCRLLCPDFAIHSTKELAPTDAES